MSIFGQVRNAKEAFKKKYDQRQAARAEMNKIELDRRRTENAVLQERRNTADALAQERSKARELKFGGADRLLLSTARTTVKKTGSVLKAFHNEALARSRVYASQPKEVGNSPFSYANLSKGLGGGSPLNRQERKNFPKKKKGGKTIIIRT